MARAAEIVAIGLGQAGGNLAAELYRRGYRAIAFNTAETDLSGLAHPSTLLPEEARIHIGLNGADGAGADPTYGRDCILHHADAIRRAVAIHAAGSDIVLLTAGLGGGTGSAICELIQVLAPLDLSIITLATIPSEHESSIAKVNAMRAVSQLMKQDALGWVFVDNSRLAEQHGDIPLDRYYPAINRLIIDPIDALNNLNRRDDIAPIRSLDGQDVLRLLMSRGVMSFLTFSERELTSEGIVKAVRDGLLHHSVQPQGLQLEYVSYMGLVIEAPESILASTSFATFEHIHQTLKRQTGGAAVHLGVYRAASPDSSATVRVFASAQSLPDGFRMMVEQAQREGKQLQAKLQREFGDLDLGDIEELELLRSSPRIVRNARALAQNARREGDTMPAGPGATGLAVPRFPAAKLATAVNSATVARERSPGVWPPPWQRKVAAPQRPPPNNRPPLPLRAAASAAMTKHPGVSGPLVNRDTYEQLVRQYKAAESQDVRDRVLDRLRSDHSSNDPGVRFLAEWAASELGNALEHDHAGSRRDDAD